MRTIQLNDDTFQIPSSWNELSHETLMLLAAQSARGIEIHELKTKVLLHLLGARIYPGIKTGEGGYLYPVYIGKKVYNLSVQDIHEMNQYVDFLFETKIINEGKKKIEKTSLYPLLYKCPYKILPCGCSKNLDNPGDMLVNLTYEEAVNLQVIHTAMRNDFWDNINKLLGILFRDRSKKFDAGQLNKYANDVIKTSNNVKMIAYWFYVGSMNYIAQKFTTVYNRSGEVKKVGHVFDQQMELAVELAGKDATKIKDLNKTLYWDVLYTIEKSNKDAEEIRKNNPKTSKKK